MDGPELCHCGHGADEHGQDEKHPGSTACTQCDCIAFEESVDAGPANNDGDYD